MGRRGQRANNMARSLARHRSTRLTTWGAVDVVERDEARPHIPSEQPGTGDRRQDITFPADELQDGMESVDRYAPWRKIEGDEEKDAEIGQNLVELVNREDAMQSGVNMYRQWNESYSEPAQETGFSYEDDDLRLGVRHELRNHVVAFDSPFGRRGLVTRDYAVFHEGSELVEQGGIRQADLGSDLSARSAGVVQKEVNDSITRKLHVPSVQGPNRYVKKKALLEGPQILDVLEVALNLSSVPASAADPVSLHMAINDFIEEAARRGHGRDEDFMQDLRELAFAVQFSSPEQWHQNLWNLVEQNPGVSPRIEQEIGYTTTPMGPPHMAQLRLEMTPDSGTRTNAEPGDLDQDQPWAAVDLDGTLLEDPTDEDYAAMDALEAETGMPQQPILKDPIEGAAEFLQELFELGWRVTIWTARFSEDLDPKTTQRFADEIADHLRSHDMPFSDIWTDAAKPRADYYVDNKAVEFGGSYSDVLQTLTTFDPNGEQGYEEAIDVQDEDHEHPVVQEENLDAHAVAIADTIDDEFENGFLDTTEQRQDLSVGRSPQKETLLNWE